MVRFQLVQWLSQRILNPFQPYITGLRRHMHDRSMQAVCWVGCFLLSLFVSLSFHGLPLGDTAPITQFPLSTKGARIVDARGQTVLLRGVNWFGLETEQQSPHGLWARDYKEMLAQIKSLGYNIIRLPYSVQSIRASNVSGIDFSIGSNQELEGKTPLQVMDAIVQEADRKGLMILLDSHRLNNQRIPELWYGDGFTEADWIDTWKMLALRYKNQPNVIGADLKNEPHGRASWGTNNPATDWRLAAERAGNAILAVNPNWLIVVEGVEKNVPGQRLTVHWMGGNLEGVGRFPVRLSHPRKLVYSPHEYGPGVFNQSWFADPNFPKNLLKRWETGFNYIATRNIAPVWIGEFGGRQVDTMSKEGIWQRQLVNFIKQKNLGFAYWSWNPNSSDTGGILLDDWQAIDQPKQQLLSQLLSSSGTQAALPKSQLRPVSAPLSAVSAPSNSRALSTFQSGSPVSSSSSLGSARLAQNSAQLGVDAVMQSDWQTGFCHVFRITNRSRTISRNWRLTFRMVQAAINNSWNGTFMPQGGQYVVTPPDWARSLQPGQTVEAGFCATKTGSDYKPKQVNVFTL